MSEPQAPSAHSLSEPTADPVAGTAVGSREYRRGPVDEIPPAHAAIHADVARQWAHRSLDVDRVLLLDPDSEAAARLIDETAALGIRLDHESEPFRAIAQAAAHEIDGLIVSAEIGCEQLEALVTVVRQQTGIPVLLAYGRSDLDGLGGAVLAGGRPLVNRPYDARQVAGVLRSTFPPRTPTAELIELAGLSLRTHAYDVTFRGLPIDLSTLEFELLRELALADGRVVPRSALATTLWPTGARPQALLTAAMQRLRRKFAHYGIDGALHTVRGIGYRLDPVVLAAADPADSHRDAAVPAVSTYGDGTPKAFASPSTRAVISSTISRTTRVGRPAGSSTGQSR